MRLIDAEVESKRLLDFIAQHDSEIQCAIEYKDMTMLEDIFFDFFNEQPTAYDVDKVIGQLEEKTELAYKRYMDCNFTTPATVRYETQYQERRMCLDIVKAGMKE